MRIALQLIVLTTCAIPQKAPTTTTYMVTVLLLLLSRLKREPSWITGEDFLQAECREATKHCSSRTNYHTCGITTRNWAVSSTAVYRVGQKKVDHFWKYVTPVYDDVGRRSIYQNVQLFIRSKTDILNVAIFKYSLHRFRETTLHQKYQLI